MATMPVDISTFVNSDPEEGPAKAGTFLADIYNAIVATSSIQSTTLEDAAKDRALVVSTEESGKLNAQQNTLTTATELGLNRSANNQVLSGLIDTINTNYTEAQRLNAEIYRKKTVSITDDPLAWIEAQLTVNDDVAAQNFAVKAHADASTQFKTINDLAQESAQTEVAIAQTRTAASVEANTRFE